MRSKLHRIDDWEARAVASGYSTATLAAGCGVSKRQLERFFMEQRGERPSQWLARLRLAQATAVLQDSQSVKAAAQAMGFRQTSHFSRAFKRQHGISPEQVQVPSMLINPSPGVARKSARPVA